MPKKASLALCAAAITAITLLPGSAVARPGVPNIAEWSRNTAGVKCVQNALNVTSSAGLKVDGIFGPATLKAVKNFQAAFRIAQDGIVGPDTGGWLGWSYDQAMSSENNSLWLRSGCWNVVPS
ncbi:peptidoglycan-binding domain-containing protein [Streptomyces sp. NPDC006476]|uniref:peptidoglycan-binding domain-containing protein n=1 Tax=Streptomyces sp. NPDC006476 TaxID=3157175 RepID=UPI0033A849ED